MTIFKRPFALERTHTVAVETHHPFVVRTPLVSALLFQIKLPTME